MYCKSTLRSAILSVLVAISASVFFSCGTDPFVPEEDHPITGSWYMECTSSNLNNVWSPDNDVAFAVGDWGMIFRYKDGEWNPMSNDVIAAFNSVWGSSETDVFVVGEDWSGDGPSHQGIFHFDGNTWTAMELWAGSRYFTSIWGRSGSDVYAVDLAGGLAAEGTVLMHYDGDGWTEIDTGEKWRLHDIWTADGADVYAAGETAVIYPDTFPRGIIVRFDGETWHREEFIHVERFRGIWGSAPDDIYAVGEVNCRDDEDPRVNPQWRGTILHFDGDGWSVLTELQCVYPPFTGVHGTSADNICVSGMGGTVLKYDGDMWRVVTTGTANDLNSISCGFDGQFISVGQDGIILVSESGTQQVEAEGSLCGLSDVWGTSMTDLYGVHKDKILSFDGIEWSRMSTPELTGDDFISIWGSSGSDIFASSYWSRRVYHYNGIGWGMMDYPGTTRIADFWGSSESDVYGVGPGWIMHFDGSVWEEELEVDYYANGIWGSSADNIFAVGGSQSTGSIILHYDGSGWEEMLSPVDYALSDVWGISGSDVYAVGGDQNNGTVIHYDGSGWTEVYSSSGLATGYLNSVWGSSGTDIYVAGTYGMLLHYDGAEWHEISVPFDILKCVWGDSENEIIVGGTNSILRYSEQ